MKKTFFTLSLLAGMASVSLAAYDANDAKALLYRDIDNTWRSSLATTTVTTSEQTGSVTLSIFDKGTEDAVTLNDASGDRISVTLILTLDTSKLQLSELSGEKSMIYLSGTGASGFGLGIDAAGKIYNERITVSTGAINQSFNNNSLSITNVNLPSEGLQTWMLTLNSVAAKNQVTGFLNANGNTHHYTNGYADWSLASVMGDFNSLTLSSAAADAICSIGVWSGNAPENDNKVSAMVTTRDVAVLPEPATATLSLLALAGLAARRRRK